MKIMMLVEAVRLGMLAFLVVQHGWSIALSVWVISTTSAFLAANR